MDQIKIGQFIKECRKEKSLTQEGLAEKLSISFKTVSKWECGRGLPDVSLMMPLCDILGISVNELLSGARIENENYKSTAEESIISILKEKEDNKKKLILTSIVVAATVLSSVTIIMLAGLLEMSNGLRIGIMVIAFACMILGISVACIIDREAGYYECPKCHEKFVPKMGSYVMGMHTALFRRLRCPNCNKVSWCRKRITK